MVIDTIQYIIYGVNQGIRTLLTNVTSYDIII
jgi:hypothetical protein